MYCLRIALNIYTECQGYKHSSEYIQSVEGTGVEVKIYTTLRGE